MAKLTPQERLQPALLDRLRDDNPGEERESRQAQVFSERELHDSVVRDLQWLLNSDNLTSGIDLGDYPEVGRSVLNYGIPDLSGKTIFSADVPAIEQAVREAIINFEPRILPHSLRVGVFVDTEAMSHNRLTFEIRGELWAKPVPLELFLLTEVDLETGSVTVAKSPS